jgi:hypothetical protein
MCINQKLFKCAVAGEREIMIFDMNTWEEIPKERIQLP